MKKSDVVNLIKFHYELDNESFYKQAFEIAREFDQSGDTVLAQYIESIMSKKFNLVPQTSSDGPFFEEVDCRMLNHLYLPDQLSSDISGVINSIRNNKGINKFLFTGLPGTGKTETAKYIANDVGRKLYSISFTNLIDSRLGETPKNIERMFSAINHTYDVSKCIFLFDEMDVIALDRINRNDVREMGRATSLFIKCLDKLNKDAVIIATTNLGDSLDKAITRRFDYVVKFNCYPKEILGEIAVDIVKELRNDVNELSVLRLVKKLVTNSIHDFSPAELRNFIRISLAFANQNDSDDFIRRLFVKLYSDVYLKDYEFMRNAIGMTVREMETVSGVSKSTLAKIVSNQGDDK